MKVIETIMRNQRVDEDNKVSIEVERVSDLLEPNQRLVYQTVEVSIYIGLPLLVTVLLQNVLSVNFYIATFSGIILLFWPIFKVSYAKIKSFVCKIADPRMAVERLNFWYDGFLFVGSAMLTEIRKYSAGSRSLDLIYNVFGRFNVYPSNFPKGYRLCQSSRLVDYMLKKWSLFWLNMPIAQDVRSRLEVVANVYEQEFCRLANLQPGRMIRVLEVAGGQLQAVIMGIRRSLDAGVNFNYEVVCIEPDTDFAHKRAQELIAIFGLNSDSFTLVASGVSTKTKKKNTGALVQELGHSVSDFDIVCCMGLVDYYFTSEGAVNLIGQFSDARLIIAANIADNHIERFYLHNLIQWPKMKYRSLEEWIEILKKAYGSRAIKIIQTPHGIFNIAVVR